MQLFERNGKYVTLEVAQKMDREEKEARYPDKVRIEEAVSPIETKPVDFIPPEQALEPVEVNLSVESESVEVDEEELKKPDSLIATDEMSDEELKKIAQERGIKGFGNMKRETLLNKLK